MKLIGGAPRVGVSARLARTALAECYGRDVSEIEEIWHALEPPYLDLFAWLDGKAERPDPGAKAVFRPVMLAHPIEEEDWPRLAPEDFAAEWKWDGIRVQIAARGGDVRMFSRQGDDISGAFPEIRAAFTGFDCVVDGELLVVRDGEIAPFNDLQQRLNRKTVTAKMLAAYPAHVRLYDLLFDGGEDLRALSFSERRARLERWHAAHLPRLTDVSPLVSFATFDDLGALWSSARAEGIEGLMLKRRDSAYQAGRIKGQWFKWKRAALTLDCVLMYAQRGSGKRSSYYSDYTFGVWRTGESGAPRACAGRQGLLRLHGRGASDTRPLDQEPHDRNLRSRPRRRAGLGVRGRLRRRAALDTAQIRRRDAVSAHPPHPLGQTRRRSRHAGNG